MRNKKNNRSFSSPLSPSSPLLRRRLKNGINKQRAATTTGGYNSLNSPISSSPILTSNSNNNNNNNDLGASNSSGGSGRKDSSSSTNNSGSSTTNIKRRQTFHKRQKSSSSTAEDYTEDESSQDEEQEEEEEREFQEEVFFWELQNDKSIFKSKFLLFFFTHSLHNWLSYLIFIFILGFCCLSVGPLLWIPISSSGGCGWCNIVKLEWIILFMIVVSALFHYSIRRDLFPLAMAFGGLYHVLHRKEPFLEPYEINPLNTVLVTLICFVVFLTKQKRLKSATSFFKLLKLPFFRNYYLNLVSHILFFLIIIFCGFFLIFISTMYIKNPHRDLLDIFHHFSSIIRGAFGGGELISHQQLFQNSGISKSAYAGLNISSQAIHFIALILLSSLVLVYHGEIKKPYTLLALGALIPQIAQTLYLLEENITEDDFQIGKPFAGGIFYILNVLSFSSFYCGLAIDVVLASIEKHDKLKAKDENYHRRISTQINEQNEFFDRMCASGTQQILEKVDFMQKFVERILSSTEDIAKKSRELESNELNTWQLQHLTSIQNQTNQSLFLLNDIKIILAIEAGFVSREDISFNIFEFINLVLEKSSKDIKSNDIELVYRIDKSVPFNIIYDPGALIQICFQLLSNAIKYTEKGEIGIIIRKLENSNQFINTFNTNSMVSDQNAGEAIVLEIAIYDTGIGMSDEELEVCNQFLPFPPLSSNEKKKGSGLGLVICNKIAKSIGGELFAERNQDTNGSVFVLRFASQIDSNPALSSVPYHFTDEQRSFYENLQILIIDDNVHNRYTSKYILSLLGAKVNTVSSSVEGIRELKLSNTLRYQYKLILIDYHMPGCDGLETIQMIMDNPLFSGIKIILMLSPSDKILKNEKTKSISYIIKPLTHLSLINGILECFNLSSNQNQSTTANDVVDNGSPMNNNTTTTTTTPTPTNIPEGLSPSDELSNNNNNNIKKEPNIIRFNSEFPLKVHDTGKPIMRVLIGIVDSSAQSEIQNSLECFGYFSTFVSDGCSMISLLKKNYYDLVILDLDLPIVNGYEVSEFIRSQEDYSHNVIFLQNPVVSQKENKLLKRRLSLGSFSSGGGGGGVGSSNNGNPVQPNDGMSIHHRRRIRLPILAISRNSEISEENKQRARDIGIDTYCPIEKISTFLKPFLIKIEKKRKSNTLLPIRILDSNKRQIDTLPSILDSSSVGSNSSSGSLNLKDSNSLGSSNTLIPSPSLNNGGGGTNGNLSNLPNISDSPSLNSNQSVTSSTNSPLSMVGSNTGQTSNKLVGIKPKQTRKIQDLENIISLFVPVEFQQLIAPTGMENVYLGDAISKTITIFFSDIREFTSTTEKMMVDDVIDFLNTYLAFAIPALTERGGFIDKFIGDAIMAIFPQSDLNEQAIFAVKAAVGMMRSLDFMHVSGFRFSTVETGIGINTGKTIIGIVGTETRMEPTALGDAVNLASRTEQLCKEYGCRILITQFTLEAIGASIDEFTVRYVDSVTVKGKSEVVDIYEVIDGEKEGVREIKIKMLPSYSSGIEQFKSANYEQALSYFQECNELLPQDKPTIIHIEKCLVKIKEQIISTSNLNNNNNNNNNISSDDYLLPFQQKDQ